MRRSLFLALLTRGVGEAAVEAAAGAEAKVVETDVSGHAEGQPRPHAGADAFKGEGSAQGLLLAGLGTALWLSVLRDASQVLPWGPARSGGARPDPLLPRGGRAVGLHAREHALRLVDLPGRDQQREGRPRRHHEGVLGRVLPAGWHRRGSVRWQNRLQSLLPPRPRGRQHRPSLRPSCRHIGGRRGGEVLAPGAVQSLHRVRGVHRGLQSLLGKS
mmetsp:Transcript_36007/g.95065  ORF Transcript_36007/g.95065 Transcript_36007/m.95065 type:complete len:216 (+) Transcript_36007:684-1331(+)